MIDPRSAEHMEHPFDGVDGTRVRIGVGPHKGHEGTILYQLGYEPRGVRVLVAVEGGEQQEFVAGDLMFLAPRVQTSLRAQLFGVPEARFVPIATGWAVWDRTTKRTVADAAGFADAQRQADERNRLR